MYLNRYKKKQNKITFLLYSRKKEGGVFFFLDDLDGFFLFGMFLCEGEGEGGARPPGGPRFGESER